MADNQFAVYQLREIPENRKKRFRSYAELQKEHIQIRYTDYKQVYRSWMRYDETPDNIRNRLAKQLPKNFSGHALSIGDVLILDKNGEAAAYYLEKEDFTVLDDFIRNDSSNTLISLATTNFQLEGKEGRWLAFDNLVVEGKEFFLMEHTTYGKNAAWVVVDGTGKLIVDQVTAGFDETVKEQIVSYLHPQETQEKRGKPVLENWQKSYENGEYLRSAEITEEQNYNMIDGRMNNLPTKPRKIGTRTSVLDRLHLKQAALNAKNLPQSVMENEIERIQLFTDNSGELFRDQVGKYMKHKYGIAWADKYLGNVSLWKNQEEKADEFTEEEEKQNDQLKDLLGEQEAELPEEENPMQHVAELKRSPILELVLPKDKTISEKQISLQEMPEKRENHTGYGAFSDVEPEDGTLTSVLLGEYVIDHFTDFTDGPKGGELDYELEYILAGRESDKGNLETVAKKLVMLRFVPNYIYLQTSSTKQAEARAAAGTLCTLLAVPAVTEAAAQGILLAWAYGESVMDVRSL